MIKLLSLISMLLIFAISSYAQEPQERYTLLLLDFEDRTGLENPLLETFNDTICFLLSRQTGPVQVRPIPSSLRDALLLRAAKMHPDVTWLEQQLHAAELANADALVSGSYTKQEKQWSLQAEVYHRREGRKARQPIQIQGYSLYDLLDGFPAQLLKQFTDVKYVALTTDSWKAYEEFRKGHDELQNYNFLGALQYYEKALELDPTLALAYSEQSYAYSLMGQGEKATEAINRAQQYVSQASPIEQVAIQALVFCWDAEAHNYQCGGAAEFLATGGSYDEEWLQWMTANAYQESGRLEEAAREYERWFALAEEKLQWKGDDPHYLYTLVAKCAGADIHLDKAIAYSERLIQLDPPPARLDDLLIYLYGQQGQVEKAFQLAPIAAYTIMEDELVEETIRLHSSLGVEGCWDALAQIVLEHHVPLEQMRKWLQPVMISDKPAVRAESHYLLAWAYVREGDLDTAKSLYEQVGSPWEQDWWVVGPFNYDVYDLGNLPPPERDTIHLDQTYEGAVGPVGWKKADDGYLNSYVESTRVLDFPEEQIVCGEIGSRIYPRVFPGRGFMKPYSGHSWAVYALIYVESSKAQNATLWLNTLTEVPWKLRLNTTVFLDGHLRDSKNIQLQKGLNEVFVRLAQDENRGLNFGLRITDSEGNPVPGLRFRSASEVLGSGKGQ